MVRSTPARRSRTGIDVDSLRGLRVGRRPAGRSAVLVIGRAGAVCVSSRLTASAMTAKHGRTVADRLAHSGEPSCATPLPDEGLVTMPHHPLLQANACMPRSWKLQVSCVSSTDRRSAPGSPGRTRSRRGRPQGRTRRGCDRGVRPRAGMAFRRRTARAAGRCAARARSRVSAARGRIQSQRGRPVSPERVGAGAPGLGIECDVGSCGGAVGRRQWSSGRVLAGGAPPRRAQRERRAPGGSRRRVGTLRGSRRRCGDGSRAAREVGRAGQTRRR